MSIVTFWCN